MDRRLVFDCTGRTINIASIWATLEKCGKLQDLREGMMKGTPGSSSRWFNPLMYLHGGTDISGPWGLRSAVPHGLDSTPSLCLLFFTWNFMFVFLGLVLALRGRTHATIGTFNSNSTISMFKVSNFSSSPRRPLIGTAYAIPTMGSEGCAS